MPLSAADSAPDNPSFLLGIHCHHCVHTLTHKKRASLEERNKQMALAEQQNATHLGLQPSEVRAVRQAKRKKLPPHTHTSGCSSDDTSHNNISDNNTTSDNTTSDNTTSDNTTSNNTTSDNTTSDNTTSGTTTSEYFRDYTRGSLVVITRVHCKSASSLVHTTAVVAFAKSSVAYADSVLILLGIGPSLTHYYSELLGALREGLGDECSKVRVEVVTPWVGFTTPLNVGVRIAVDEGYDYALFQSLEVQCTSEDVRKLMNCFDERTLVVGPVLQGHDFTPSLATDCESESECVSEGVPLRGRTCPWNTCAVWRLDKLGVVGFPLIGDGITTKRVSEGVSGGTSGKKDPSLTHSLTHSLDTVVTAGGVEEVSAVAFAQLLNPHWTAKLVQFKQTSASECASEGVSGGVRWDTCSFSSDEQRVRYHESKMRSKDSRAAAQLAVAGDALQLQGRVLHVEQ